MQVFKEYFKIIRKSALPSLILYFGIFLAMTIIFSNLGSSSNIESFEVTKCNVAVINKDSSPLSKNLEKYIKDNTKTAKIKTNDEGIKDALFFRDVEVVITIPEGFGANFTSPSASNIEIQNIPNSSSSMLISTLINNYLYTTDLYKNTLPVLDFNEIDNLVREDLAKKAEVNIDAGKENDYRTSATYFFNYLPYPALCILILGISIVANVFNEPNIKRRNLCSPINDSSFNLQIFLGHFTLAIICWLLFTVLALIMYPSEMISFRGFLYSMNSLIFMTTALALSFFISNLVPKKAINGVCNCVALGSCFLGGAFVPQFLLSDAVKNTALINPVYWYININEKLASLSSFNIDTLKPILLSSIIMLAFAIAFLSMSLVVIKSKRTSYN